MWASLRASAKRTLEIDWEWSEVGWTKDKVFDLLELRARFNTLDGSMLVRGCYQLLQRKRVASPRLRLSHHGHLLSPLFLLAMNIYQCVQIIWINFRSID